MALLLSYSNESATRTGRRTRGGTTDMKRKKKRASTKICDPAACHHCTYIGEGDFMCDNHPDEAVVLVISDWDPTEYFLHCAQTISTSAKKEVAKV